MGDQDETFESQDSGAAESYPIEAGQIRKGGHIVIKNRPCKVSDVSTSKTGKHGHAKCHFVAIDIFTGKKLEDLTPSSHNCEVPHVNRTDFTLLNIEDDGYVSLMDDNGQEKADLALPNDDSLRTSIENDFAAGKDLVVSVLSAMGEETIIACKESAASKA